MAKKQPPKDDKNQGGFDWQSIHESTGESPADKDKNKEQLREEIKERGKVVGDPLITGRGHARRMNDTKGSKPIIPKGDEQADEFDAMMKGLSQLETQPPVAKPAKSPPPATGSQTPAAPSAAKKPQTTQEPPKIPEAIPVPPDVATEGIPVVQLPPTEQGEKITFAIPIRQRQKQGLGPVEAIPFAIPVEENPKQGPAEVKQPPVGKHTSQVHQKPQAPRPTKVQPPPPIEADPAFWAVQTNRWAEINLQETKTKAVEERTSSLKTYFGRGVRDYQQKLQNAPGEISPNNIHMFWADIAQRWIQEYVLNHSILRPVEMSSLQSHLQSAYEQEKQRRARKSPGDL